MVNFLIPLIAVIIILYGLYKKIDIYDTFMVGVKEGLTLSIKLFPSIFTILVAVTMLSNSNIINDLCYPLSPILNYIHFPSTLLPLAILRPISGSSALAFMNNILLKYGPDSFIGRVASVMQGSTDTTIYIISMYFASVGIKKIKYSLIVGLLADLISVILSVVMVRLILY